MRPTVYLISLNYYFTTLTFIIQVTSVELGLNSANLRKLSQVINTTKEFTRTRRESLVDIPNSAPTFVPVGNKCHSQSCVGNTVTDDKKERFGRNDQKYFAG